jgi:O-antigen/teichoic acid export membrane protein
MFGRIDTLDHRRRRLLGIVQGVVTNLGNKIIGMGVSFLSVPLTIHYLGPERYGVWVALGSLLAWLSLTDFGVGNGLNNVVTTSASQERPDLVRMHLSNGVFMLSALAAVAGLIAIIAWPFIDWAALLGVKNDQARAELGPAIAISLAIFLLKFPLSASGKVYLAYQEGRIGNYWGMVGNVLSLVSLLIVVRTEGGLVWLVIAVSGISLLLTLANNIWVFGFHRPELRPALRYVDFKMMRGAGTLSGKFFLIQIMALITFETDNLVISHYLGAAQVPSYSLTYSLLSYTALPQSLLFGYLWNAYTDAIARRDIAWVSRTFHLNLFLGMALSAVALVAVAFIARPFIGWWAGPEVVPSTALIEWVAAWFMINAFTAPIACLLAAAAHLRLQIIYSTLATVSNIILSINLVQTWGITGVIAASVISYTVFICGPLFFVSERLIVRLQHEM